MGVLFGEAAKEAAERREIWRHGLAVEFWRRKLGW